MRVTPDELSKVAQKSPFVSRAAKVDAFVVTSDMEIETADGAIQARPGDALLVGDGNALTHLPRSVFQAHFEEVKATSKPVSVSAWIRSRI